MFVVTYIDTSNRQYGQNIAAIANFLSVILTYRTKQIVGDPVI